MDTEQHKTDSQPIEEKTVVGAVKYVVLPPHEIPYSEQVKESEPVPVQKDMTEQSYASPIINNIPDGGRDNNDGMGALAGILPIALLAPLLGLNRRDGEGRNLEAVIAEQMGDLRHEIGETAIAGLKQAFEADKDALRAGFKAEIETLKVANQLENKIDFKVGEVMKEVGFMKSSMDNKFCELEHQVERGFAHVAERELKEEITELKESISARNAADTNGLLAQLVTLLGGVPTPLAKKA